MTPAICANCGAHHALFSPCAAVTALHVLPAYQSKGVGSALLHYGLTVLHLDQWPVFVVTTMRGCKIYRKFGWEQVDFIDVDLGARGKGEGLEGYGVHRSPCLIKAPTGELN